MNLQQRIEAAEAEVMRLKDEQLQCLHKWGPVVHTPSERITNHYEESGGGSDYRPAGSYSYDTDPTWTRTCKVCGKKETTDRCQTVVVKEEKRPLF